MRTHTFKNSNPTEFDSNCAVCDGKQHDSVHGATDEIRKATAADLHECYAEPAAGNIIDAIDSRTGLTLYGSKTEAEIKAEYPEAVRMTLEAFMTAKAERQNTPVVWTPSTPEQYEEMLCCLPPAVWNNLGFMVGEPDDHDAKTGRPRFRAYVKVDDGYFVASRPMTVKDFNAITPESVLQGAV